MLAFLLPLASKIIKDAVARIPDNEELGEKMVEICLVILKKAVTLTETDMDDKLLAVVEQAIQKREAAWYQGAQAPIFLSSTYQIAKSR